MTSNSTGRAVSDLRVFTGGILRMYVCMEYDQREKGPGAKIPMIDQLRPSNNVDFYISQSPLYGERMNKIAKFGTYIYIFPFLHFTPFSISSPSIVPDLKLASLGTLIGKAQREGPI